MVLLLEKENENITTLLYYNDEMFSMFCLKDSKAVIKDK